MHDVACKKCPTANVRKGLNATWVFSLEIGVKLFMVRKLSTWDLDIFGQSAFQCILSKVLMATCLAGSLFGVVRGKHAASRTDAGSSSFSQLTGRLILQDGTEVARQAR